MPTEHATPSLIHRVRQSAAASAIGQIASQVISIGSLAVLLRLVGPTNYGLVGMIAPIILFLRIFTTFGLNVATVQRARISSASLSSLFWMTLLGGVVTASIAGALGPFVAGLYARPELKTELTRLTWALGGTLLLWAIGAQHIALLERRLRFGRLASIRVTSQFAGAAAAAVAAFGGWGVWALVLQQYVELALLAALAWISDPWRPHLPTAKSRARSQLENQNTVVRDTMRFGAYFAGASVVLFVADQLDRVLLGRLAGPDAVGLYGQAKQLMIKPVYLVTMPISAILLSGVARSAEATQAEQPGGAAPGERRALLAAFYRLLAIILAPASVGLSFVAGDVMRLLGGDAWRASGTILTALALATFAQAVIIINGWVLAARGKTTKLFAYAVLVLLGQVVGIVAGWMIGVKLGNGVVGVAWGVTIATYAVAALHTVLTMRAIDDPLLPILRAWRPSIAATLLMAIALWALGPREIYPDSFARLALMIPVGVLVYAIAAWKEIRWLHDQLRQLRRPD